jgi:colanic acid biosynthesis glycosyl transferase WcaI
VTSVTSTLAAEDHGEVADDTPPIDLSHCRFLIYSMNYAPELRGAGRYTGEIGAYLARCGATLEVVTTPPHYPGWVVPAPFKNAFSRSRDGKVGVTHCPLALRPEMRGIWRLLAPLSFALSSAPVVIWRILILRPHAVLMIEPTLLAAPAALAAAQLSGARTLLHVQDLEIDAAFAMGHLKSGLLQRLAAGFEKLTLKAFDQLVTISGRMRDRLADKGISADRLSIIRNWVDLEKIRPLAGPNPYRAELDLKPDAFVVLYAGNIGVKQALDVVLDSAAQLVDRDNIVFVIAGDGPEKRKLVAAAGPNVRFLPLQPENRLCELLNFADLHVLPQHAGAADLVLPSKLGGMLASGKPIVVAADPGTELAEFLQGTATLIPSGDPSALAAAIREQAKVRAAARPQQINVAKTLSSTDALLRFATLIAGNHATSAPVR